MEIIEVCKKNKILSGTVFLPASKSISNRILILNHLAKKTPSVLNLSNAGDTELLIELLILIEKNYESSETIEIDCKNAGTVFRFLTSVLAITPGKWLLTGSPRMKQRPVGELVKALQNLGADISYVNTKTFPPILIQGKTLKGGTIEIDASISSQFISSLIMIAPFLENGLELILINKISSRPYIFMTLQLLKHYGIKSLFKSNRIIIKKQLFLDKEMFIEADWSSAAFWYEMVALSKEADLQIFGLKKDSLQGDSKLPDIFEKLGVATTYTSDGIRITRSAQNPDNIFIDFSDFPDLAQAVIVTCAARNQSGVFFGLESLRIKETDRISAMVNELSKVGVKIKYFKTDSGSQGLELSGENNPVYPLQIIETYEDHRMAMSFAPLAIYLGSIKLKNPNIVSKSYPDFWNEIKKVGFTFR